MSLKVIKIGTDHFNHTDGSKSPVEKYKVNLEGKSYEVHIGCKEPEFDWKISTYVWTSNGRFCDPSKDTHKKVSHLFWIIKNANLIEDTEEYAA